ncbi:MAG: hypothetical protein ACYS5V_02065 [Planctomycetota bacterium]|jgi:hypothetical protein
MPEKNIWIAVPTYWTHPSGADGPETVTFDHPTPLDTDGTLARTLESFTHLEGDFKVLIVAAGAHPDLGERIHQCVGELARPFADRLDLYLVGPARLAELNAQLPAPILSLDSYGNIRNVQLIVPFALGADAVVGIDDDEIVPDTAFLSKAARIGERRADGELIGGMAGPYYDANGEYRIAGAEELGACPNLFLKKNHFMDRAIDRAMTQVEPDGLIRSNVAFGGNMVMSRATIARTCHDPYIARGEDYDYVINAAMDGTFYYFQPAMAITHLPPDSTGAQAADKESKLLADISRFIYMQEKMRLHGERFPAEAFDYDYLHPYPGPYVDPTADLPAHAVAALDEKYPHYRQSADPQEFVDRAITLATARAEEFFAYRTRWRTALAGLADNAGFRGVCQTLRVP